MPLDELVGAPDVGDPRIRLKPRTRNGRLVFPLTQQSSGLQVWKVVIPPERERELRTHEGYEWLYVLSGEMRLILGEHDITMGPARSPSSTRGCRTGSARRETSPSRSSASTEATGNGCTSAPHRAARPRRPDAASSARDDAAGPRAA